MHYVQGLGGGGRGKGRREKGKGRGGERGGGGKGRGGERRGRGGEGRGPSLAAAGVEEGTYLEEVEDLRGEGLDDEPGIGDDHEAEGLAGDCAHDPAGAGCPNLLSPGAQQAQVQQ